MIGFSSSAFLWCWSPKCYLGDSLATSTLRRAKIKNQDRTLSIFGPTEAKWPAEKSGTWVTHTGRSGRQKPTQYCKAIILQLKRKKFVKKKKKRPGNFQNWSWHQLTPQSGQEFTTFTTLTPGILNILLLLTYWLLFTVIPLGINSFGIYLNVIYIGLS